MERNRFGSLSRSTQAKRKTFQRAGGVMLAVLAAGLFMASGAQAAIVYSGDISPADPTTWTSSTNPIIGNTSTGSITVDGGSVLNSYWSQLGYTASGNGTVTVDGAGSTWNLSSGFYVGVAGRSTLSIINGGKVYETNSGAGSYVGYGSGSIGTMIVDGVGSMYSHMGTMQIGGANGATGTFSVTHGGTFNAVSGSFSVGSYDRSTGRLIVDGSGSTFSLPSGTFYSSRNGNGATFVTNGASFSVKYLRMGLNRGSVGTMVVDGAGTNVSAGSYLYLGSSSYSTGLTDKFSVSNGASVTTPILNIYYSGSTLTMDVGKGSSLTVGGGSGTLTNSGTIRLVAGANAANGTYTPISAGTWTNTGTVQALGGIWDATNHTVTVTSAAAAAGGSALTADLAITQRFLFTDGATGKKVGAAFQAATTPTNLTLTASAISGSELTSLQGLLATGQAVLSGWDFNAAEGYTAGSPVYLSLSAGSGHSLYDLNIWHYDGSAWSKFDASDLAYDKTFASFTATGFSGYAVTGTAPVPLPPAFYMFGSGLLGLIGARRKFFGK